MKQQDSEIIEKSKAWVERVVIGLNFCPFAGKAFIEHKIHFEVVNSSALKEQLASILSELERLDQQMDLETTLILFPDQFPEFEAYLDFVSLAEGLLAAHDYEGVYQIASFHPAYLFAGSDEEDPANYTNRSPYPMVHLLRESSVTKAVESYPNVEEIPNRNVDFAQEQGLERMRLLAKGE